MTAYQRPSSVIRLLTVGALIATAAYWAGSRYGEHEIQRVESVFAQGGSSRTAPRPESLTADESLTVKIYSQASPAVANMHGMITVLRTASNRLHLLYPLRSSSLSKDRSGHDSGAAGSKLQNEANSDETISYQLDPRI